MARELGNHNKLDKEIHKATMKLETEEIDVAEIHSVELSSHNRRYRRGIFWNFSKHEMRQRAINKINKDQPLHRRTAAEKNQTGRLPPAAEKKRVGRSVQLNVHVCVGFER